MIAEPRKKAASSPESGRIASSPRRATGVVAPPPAPGTDAVRKPMAQRGPRVVRRAREFGWRSPMAAATLAASFFVSLAALYVAAYARVTAESFELSQLTRKVKAADMEKAGLQAEISRLTLPDTVKKHAEAMGMVETNTQTTQFVFGPAAAKNASDLPTQ